MNWGASSNTLPHSRELQNDWPTSGSTSKLLVLERAGGLVAPGVTQLAAAYRAQPSHSAPRNRRLDLYVNLPLFYRLFRCFLFFEYVIVFFFLLLLIYFSICEYLLPRWTRCSSGQPGPRIFKFKLGFGKGCHLMTYRSEMACLLLTYTLPIKTIVIK